MKHLFFQFKKIGYAFLGFFFFVGKKSCAAIELNRAIADARAKHAKTGHRYYCIWDAVQKRLVALPYDGYRGRTDSYQYMRHRGAFPPVSRDKFMESAFFYTGSKNGASEMTVEQSRNKLQLLRSRYYSSKP